MRIAILNRKGGVGKSTTAVHLAHGLAIAGRRVLLVDTDPQGNCAVMLAAQYQASLAHVLTGSKTAAEAIVKARDGLDLLPSDSTLSDAADVALSRPYDPQLVLREKLEGLDYDDVIVDTAPSLSRLTVNAVFYAEAALVPVSMQLLAMRGLADVEEEMAVLERHGAAPLRYVVATMCDNRKKLTQAVLDTLEGKYRDRMGPAIRYQARFDELDGKTMFESDPNGRGANDYAGLVEAVVYGK